MTSPRMTALRDQVLAALADGPKLTNEVKELVPGLHYNDAYRALSQLAKRGLVERTPAVAREQVMWWRPVANG